MLRHRTTASWQRSRYAFNTYISYRHLFLTPFLQVGDGSKAVKVGTRIAVLAEPGDDLSTLEIPREDTSAQSSKPAESQKEPTAQPPAAAGSQPRATTPAKPAEGSAAKTADSAGKAQKQKYPLYPSVLHLLKENGLSKEDADKIPASGPNGRLLKGDVLSYLGRIEQDYSAEQSKRIAKLGHLDLSNIKVVQPKKTQPTPPPTSAVEAPVEKPDTEIAIPISLEAVLAVQKRIQSTLGVHLPLETFIVRATDLANDALPRSKSAKPTQDELFNAILGLDKVSSTTSRGSFVPQITALPSVSTSPRAVKKPESDILDILAGKKSASARAPKVVPVVAAPVKPVFSVSVPKGDERRAKVFLERVKVVLEEEPGNLIL